MHGIFCKIHDVHYPRNPISLFAAENLVTAKKLNDVQVEELGAQLYAFIEIETWNAEMNSYLLLFEVKILFNLTCKAALGFRS